MRTHDMFWRTCFGDTCDTSLQRLLMAFSVSSMWTTSLVRLACNHERNPFHANLMRTSFTSLWSLTARLYLRSSITPEIEPSAITPNQMHRFRNPASWNRFPTIASSMHMEWNTPSLMMTVVLNLSANLPQTASL